MKKECINSRIPLVQAVTERLAEKAVLTPAGVPALDHLLVLLPTRQAGRRLREALADTFPSGCIPPVTLQASAILQIPESAKSTVMTRIESVALLAKMLEKIELASYPALFPEQGHPQRQDFTWSLSISGQLHQLWNTLEENALCMSDVAAQIGYLLDGEDLDTEIERWNELGRLEKLFFSEIESMGMTPIPTATKAAAASPAIPEGCREIILPALVDAVPSFYRSLENIPSSIKVTLMIQFDGDIQKAFDKYGVPDPSFWNSREAPPVSIEDSCIHATQESADQAAAVAAYFDSIPADEALPALGMADADLFSELETAFLNRGIRIHNPAGVPLSGSSLAKLIQQIRNFNRDAPFSLLASFLRQADTRRLTAFSNEDNALLLRALDTLQNTHIPQTVSETMAFCTNDIETIRSDSSHRSRDDQLIHGLRLLKETIGNLLKLTDADSFISPVDQLIENLKIFFSGRVLTDINTIDRELAAAASKILDMRDALQTPLIRKLLNHDEISGLFDEMLKNSIYQLEPSAETEILTEGWLELIWNPSAEIVISGFNEGSVPAAVVGHAFLPDRLRKALNMVCNDLRTARDTYLLYSLVHSRQPGAVRIYLEQVNSDGDVRKPSRLLFKCDDQTLAGRAKRLFEETNTPPPERPRILPEAWKLNLPFPSDDEVLDNLSVSAISAYLQCPFTFYLKCILNMQKQDDRTEEMDALVFGTLCHTAVERFTESPFANSTDAAVISGFLEEQVLSLAEERFGSPMPVVIQLQAHTAARRLAFFAEEQAERTAKGWRIAAGEEKLSQRINGINIRGRADRIDYHPESNTVQIIDFKTWNRLPTDKGRAKFATRSGAMTEYAEARGMHLYSIDEKSGYALTDMQLPLYMLMMPGRYLHNRKTKVECAYFVLGDSRSQCRCFAWNLEQHRQNFMSDLHLLTQGIRQGLYWPPSPADCWRNDYAELFLNKPEGEIRDKWIENQKARSMRMY
ncbi:MAG: PD-(D/E)XK nuclease family protein [Kiritimatiellia bacterium]